jgi:glutamine synthetase
MADRYGIIPSEAEKKSPEALLKWAKDNGAREVDVKFTDIRGVIQHFSIPFQNFSADAFTEGLGFDGSSIQGFQTINVSDLNLLPDPATAFIDPIPAKPTLSLSATCWTSTATRMPATRAVSPGAPRNT